MDLKLFTPAHKRLKCSVKWYDSQDNHVKDIAFKRYPNSYTQLDHVTPRKSIITNKLPNPNHFKVNNQSTHIEPLEAEHSLSTPAQIKQDHIIEDNMADNHHACDDYGLLLENIHDLQKHVKNRFPEKNFTLKRKLPS